MFTLYEWIRVRIVGNKLIIPLALILLLLPPMISPDPSATLSQIPVTLNNGPYVDKLVYKVIANPDQRVIALQEGMIEMDLDYFDPILQPVLEGEPNIDIHTVLRNGYGHLTINCDRYPLNISGFRRAFAYAYDKTRVTTETFDGFSIEHDSLIPAANSWCIEDELDWHYYTNQSDIGNQILDNLNFSIDQGTGYRLAPDGTPFDVVIENWGSYYVPLEVAAIGVDALQSLHINSTRSVGNYEDIINRVFTLGDFDIIFYGFESEGNDVEWLAQEYWSELGDGEYQNPGNFRNTTFDSYCDQLLNGTSYADVYEAASEMQKVLQYNVPRLVVYTNIYPQGYRTDHFTGYVPDLYRHIAGPWTMRNIQRIDGEFGGTVSIAFAEPPDTFNIFVPNSVYSEAILEELYSSLYDYGPDGYPVKDLAESLVIETHEDNPVVPEGHTRYTIDIIQNATWNDGTQLSAEDISFTYNYLIEGNITNMFAPEDIHGIWAPSPFRVIVEYSSESYWNFAKFAYNWIIPQHIFNNETGIGYEGWETWNPVLNSADPHVTSGPFSFTDYEVGEYYELTYNPNFYFAPDRTPPSTTDTPTSSPTAPIEPGTLFLTIISIAAGTSIGVLTLVLIRVIRNRKQS